jgi:hypothetical protein
VYIVPAKGGEPNDLLAIAGIVCHRPDNLMNDPGRDCQSLAFFGF